MQGESTQEDYIHVCAQLENNGKKKENKTIHVYISTVYIYC